MVRSAVVIFVCLLAITGILTGCSQNRVEQITFDQLLSNPGGYRNKEVTIEGFYFQGFEISVLSERLEYSGFAEGHIVPKGRMIWISGGISAEIYDRLDRQQMMGPSERYGKISISGKFEYGGRYGHLDGYDSQIIPTAVHLVPPSR